MEKASEKIAVDVRIKARGFTVKAGSQLKILGATKAEGKSVVYMVALA